MHGANSELFLDVVGRSMSCVTHIITRNSLHTIPGLRSLPSTCFTTSWDGRLFSLCRVPVKGDNLVLSTFGHTTYQHTDQF